MKRIVYSKDAIKYLITIPEPETTVLIENLKAYIVKPNSVDAKRITESADRRILLKSNKHYVIFKMTKFKGQDVLYVMYVFPKEELRYFIDT